MELEASDFGEYLLKLQSSKTRIHIELNSGKGDISHATIIFVSVGEDLRRDYIQVTDAADRLHIIPIDSISCITIESQ